MDDTYDERDVDWVKQDDGFVRAVLASHKVHGDVNKAVDSLNVVLLFRAKWQVNGITF